MPKTASTAEEGGLFGSAQGLPRDHVTGEQGVWCLVQIYWPVVPDLGRNLVSVNQAARSGGVSICFMNKLRLETSTFTLPLQELGHDLYYFSLDLNAGSDATKLAIQAGANTNLWHRRLGHLNR